LEKCLPAGKAGKNGKVEEIIVYYAQILQLSMSESIYNAHAVKQLVNFLYRTQVTNLYQ